MDGSTQRHNDHLGLPPNRSPIDPARHMARLSLAYITPKITKIKIKKKLKKFKIKKTTKTAGGGGARVADVGEDHGPRAGHGDDPPAVRGE